MTLLYDGGVAIGWRATDPTKRVEVLRAPDDGAGGPDTASEISLAIVSPPIAGYVDLSAGVNLTRYHYRVRHVFPGYDAGTASKYIRGHGVEFNTQGVTLPIVSTSAASSQQVPNALWVQAGGTIISPFFVPAQHAVFGTLSLTTAQTTSSVAGYHELQNTIATTQPLIALEAVSDTRHTSGTVADTRGMVGVGRVNGAGGTTTTLTGIDAIISRAAGLVTTARGLNITTFGDSSITNAYGIQVGIVSASATRNVGLRLGTVDTQFIPNGDKLIQGRIDYAGTGTLLGVMIEAYRSSATATLTEAAGEFVFESTHTSGTCTTISAIQAVARHTGAGGTVTNIRAVDARPTATTGTVTNITAIYANNAGGAGTVTNAYEFYGQSPDGGTNRYGMYLESVTGGTTNYALYTNAGRVVFNAGAAASSQVWIGHTTAATGSPILDVVGGQPTLILSTSTTNAILKNSILAGRHYTNAEEAVQLIAHHSDASISDVAIGGGYGTVNAATSISFYTAANTTTLTGTLRVTINSSGHVILTAPVRLQGYTVATLPAGTQGDSAFVTDALAPSFLTALVGGGAAVTPAFYDGTNWVAF